MNATQAMVGTVSAALAAGCVIPEASGELCVYTARSPGQIVDELPLFVASHPRIALRCRGVDPADLYCPSRIDGSRPDCEDQDAEPWVVVRRSTGSLTRLLIEEGAATRADVLWGLAISHLWYFRDNTDLLRPYQPEHFARVRDAAMSARRRGTLWTSFVEPEVWDERSFSTPTAVGIDAFATVFCVDPEKVAARLPMWDGTLSWSQVVELFPGEVVMPNPTRSGSGFAAVVGILEDHRKFGSGTPAQRERAGWEFLRRLDAAVDKYTTTGDGPCELVARGEYAIGVTHDAADQLPHGDEVAGPGEPARVFPAPDPERGGRRMLGYDVAAIALIEKGPATRPAALEFLDWALSPEAMTIYAEQTPLTAYDVRGTPLPQGYPGDFSHLPDTELDFNVIAAERAAIQERWTAEFCANAPDEPTSRCAFVVDG